ncbi:MAG: ribonuclease Z [Candidatus Diapherotrites archaeon]|nr:ribonuclease Z [Candidatus Diapherotrites archaeon]
MKLAILGSGVPTSSSKKCNSGYLLEVGKIKILIDLGNGVFKNLQKVINPIEVQGLFVSHFLHQDHINDLPPFLSYKGLMTKRAKFRKNAKKPVTIFAGKSFKQSFNLWSQLFPVLFTRVQDLNLIKIKELNPKQIVRLPSLKITCAQMKHTVPCLGYRFEHKGKSIVYSGDAEYSKELVQLAKNTDILLADCTKPEAFTGHMGAKECGQVAREANVKTLVLTHLGMESEQNPKMLKQIAGKYFKGKIIIAKDLMKLNI